MYRTAITLLFISLLQSCGLADRFFGPQECDDGSCEAPVLLDNSTSERKWYCYGTEADQPWQCQNSADDSKIVAVKPQTAPQPERSQFEPQGLLTQTEPTPAPRLVMPVSSSIEKILQTPPDHYAVQLIALRDLAGVQEYATLNGIQEPMLVKIRNDQTDWYILLLGVYPDRSLAEAAKREWETAKVLRVQPWIRQLGGLQDAMRLAQEPS